MTYEETLAAVLGLLGRECRATISLREDSRDALVGFFLGTLSRGMDVDLSKFTENSAEIFASGESVFFVLSGTDAAGAVAIRERDFDIGFREPDGEISWIRRGGVRVQIAPVDLTDYGATRSP